MNLTAVNAVYLRQKRTLLLPVGSATTANPTLVATLLKNIEAFGFTLSAAAIERLHTYTPDELQTVHGDLIAALQELTGAHRVFRPMYPNFPAQVMAMHQAELYLRAIFHYLTGIVPAHDIAARAPLLEHTDLAVIDLGTPDDLRGLVPQLLSATTALSPQDRADVAVLVTNLLPDVLELLPERISNKENLALLAALLMQHLPAEAETVIGRSVTNATDVLRLAAALSDGDTSLAQPIRFRSFTRRERKLLLALVEDNAEAVYDMVRFRERWLRLGERLHPGEWRGRYPRTAAAFDTLRANTPVVTFGTRVEAALRAGDVQAALDVLVEQPGQLARRLDHLLRLAGDWEPIAQAFETVAPRVATSILLTVMAHMRHRSHPAGTQSQLRTIFPKGTIAKVQALPETRPPLTPAAAEAIVGICRQALTSRFRRLPPLGRCYVDPALATYHVPFALRSASKALRTVARGSRITLPDKHTLRFFLWWKERPRARADVDLSAVLLRDDWSYVETISYFNLRSSRIRAAHSGDIVTAPHGAAEFIDIDRTSALKHGVRYVVMSVNLFHGSSFIDLPECFAGWMAREHPQSGEIFEPATVEDRFDLTAETRIALPVIFDLHDGQAIWADLALKRNPNFVNNVHTNSRSTTLMAQAITHMVRPSLYDLFALHIDARGEHARREDADMVFARDGDVTPFDVATITSTYLV